LEDKKSVLPDSFPYLMIIGGIYAAIELITGGNYNIFRDEYYYIDCANHISFGYVDHPPLSILILAAWKFIFSSSLLSIRVLPALCGASLIFITAKITEALGGNKSAQIFSAIAVSAPLTYFVIFGFYSMNAFDIVFWALLYLILINIINTGNQKLWLWFGVVAGLGLMNKISVGYFGAGVVAAMLCAKERKWFANKFFWLGGIIALVIFSPYIVWNLANGMPTLEFIHNATQYKNADIPALVFAREQILQINPLNAFVWIAGIAALFFSGSLKKYRVIALSYIFIFLILIVQKSKPYYLAAAYPVLLAAGSAAITDFFERKKLAYLRYTFSVLLIISIVLLSPIVLPVLQPAELNAYFDKIGYKPETGEKSNTAALPQYFADRFGWEELAKEMARVYNSMGDDEKKKTALVVGNYGEAGSLNYYAKKYGLPFVYCAHNSCWFWGREHGFDGLENVIILGGKREEHLEQFEDVQEAGKISAPYVMPFEDNLKIFIARHLRKGIDLEEVWKKEKEFI
jgi:hypothetical protein